MRWFIGVMLCILLLAGCGNVEYRDLNTGEEVRCSVTVVARGGHVSVSYSFTFQGDAGQAQVRKLYGSYDLDSASRNVDEDGMVLHASGTRLDGELEFMAEYSGVGSFIVSMPDIPCGYVHLTASVDGYMAYDDVEVSCSDRVELVPGGSTDGKVTDYVESSKSGVILPEDE